MIQRIAILHAVHASDFRFKLAGAQRLICRFEDKSRVKDAHAHPCRLEIKPSVVSLQLDRPPKDRDRRDVKLLATHRQDFADDEWHEVEVTFADDTLCATTDEQTKLEGRHEHLSHEELGVIIVVQQGVALLDDLSLQATETADSSTSPVRTCRTGSTAFARDERRMHRSKSAIVRQRSVTSPTLLVM